MSSPATGRRVALAAVAGAHGVKGELRLKLFTDSVDSLARHSRFWVGGRRSALKDIKDGGKTAIARFEGISDRTAAEALRDSLIEVERDQLTALDAGEYYHADLVWLPCIDASGMELGTVVAVETFGDGDRLDVGLPGGKRSLIPFRDPMARLDGDRMTLNPAFLA